MIAWTRVTPMLLRCPPRDTLSSALIARGSRYSKRRSTSFILPESIEPTGSNVLRVNRYSQPSGLRPLNGSIKHEDASWISLPPFFVFADEFHLATVMVHGLACQIYIQIQKELQIFVRRPGQCWTRSVGSKASEP